MWVIMTSITNCDMAMMTMIERHSPSLQYVNKSCKINYLGVSRNSTCLMLSIEKSQCTSNHRFCCCKLINSIRFSLLPTKLPSPHGPNVCLCWRCQTFPEGSNSLVGALKNSCWQARQFLCFGREGNTIKNSRCRVNRHAYYSERIYEYVLCY